MGAVKVCECGRVKIGSAWIRCINVISQLREQGVEIEITNCDECVDIESHTAVGALYPCGVTLGAK